MIAPSIFLEVSLHSQTSCSATTCYKNQFGFWFHKNFSYTREKFPQQGTYLSFSLHASCGNILCLRKEKVVCLLTFD